MKILKRTKQSLDLCFMTNTPGIEKFLSFYIDGVISKLGIRVHFASFKLISFLNNEIILSAFPVFGFAIKVNSALLVQMIDQFLISCWSITWPHSHLFAFVLLKYLQIIIACGKHQTLESSEQY